MGAVTIVRSAPVLFDGSLSPLCHRSVRRWAHASITHHYVRVLVHDLITYLPTRIHGYEITLSSWFCLPPPNYRLDGLSHDTSTGGHSPKPAADPRRQIFWSLRPGLSSDRNDPVYPPGGWSIRTPGLVVLVLVLVLVPAPLPVPLLTLCPRALLP